MKNLAIILTLILIVLGWGANAHATDGPLITPESFFWKFKLVGERVILAFEGLRGEEAQLNYLSDLMLERKLEIQKMFFEGKTDLDLYSKGKAEQKNISDRYITILNSIEEDQRLEQLRHDEFVSDEFDSEFDFSTMITSQMNDVNQQILEAQKNGNQKKEAELKDKLKDLGQSYDDASDMLESWQTDANQSLEKIKSILPEDDRKEFLGGVSDEPQSIIVYSSPTPSSRILIVPTPTSTNTLPIPSLLRTPESTPIRTPLPTPPPPVLTSTPYPTVVYTPTFTPTIAPTPSSTLTPSPSITPTPTPIPSASPTPIPTPTPSPTPTTSSGPSATPQASNDDLQITITSNYCTDGGELIGYGWRWSWYLSGTAKTSHDRTYLRVWVPEVGGASQTSCSSWGEEGGGYCVRDTNDPEEIQWSFMWDGIALSSSLQHATIWYNLEGSTSPTKVEVEFMECPSTVVNRY